MRDSLPCFNLQLSSRHIISNSTRFPSHLPDDTFQEEKQMYALIYVICRAELRHAWKMIPYSVAQLVSCCKTAAAWKLFLVTLCLSS